MASVILQLPTAWCWQSNYFSQHCVGSPAISHSMVLAIQLFLTAWCWQSSYFSQHSFCSSFISHSNVLVNTGTLFFVRHINYIQYKILFNNLWFYLGVREVPTLLTSSWVFMERDDWLKTEHIYRQSGILFTIFTIFLSIFILFSSFFQPLFSLF